MTHLVILCHGMWGNISHFAHISQELKDRGIDELELSGGVPKAWADAPPHAVFFRARSNTGYFTYDGIDVCGTRVANEVLAAIEALETAGVPVTALSMMGYSMGGLMVRYAAGVLYTKGVFDRVAPGTFSTLFSPHMGVNVLGQRASARIFNFVGSYSMARTSRQMFLQDVAPRSRTTLFEHMVDSATPYVKALKLFTRRVLYSNIVNDRRCEYYTAAVEKVDPFHGRTDALTGEYVPGYGPVILASPAKAEFTDPTPPPPRRRLPFWLAWPKRVAVLIYTSLRIGLVLPLWFVAFLCNAAYQTTLSTARTRLMVQRGEHVPNYHFEDMLEDRADSMVETVYGAVGDGDQLAFTPTMERIHAGFNEVAWDKYPVHITLDKNAHAAAIVRFADKASFREGRVVIKHWIDEVLLPGLSPA